MRKRIVAAVAALSVCLILQASMPRAARAGSDTVKQAAIIGGAVTGGLIVVAVIGTLLMRNDPRLLLQPEEIRPADRPGPRFGTSCPQTPAGSLALCW